jgi:thiol:disulfide interchange protein
MTKLGNWKFILDKFSFHLLKSGITKIGLITVIIIQFRNILLQLCFNRQTDAILTLPWYNLHLPYDIISRWAYFFHYYFERAAWIWVSATNPGNTTAGQIPAPRQGFLAPDFSLQDLQGETVTLSELRGRPVLINLWATWCPPCRAEMPDMQEVYEAYQEQGFLILAVNATYQDSAPLPSLL